MKIISIDDLQGGGQPPLATAPEMAPAQLDPMGGSTGLPQDPLVNPQLTNPAQPKSSPIPGAGEPEFQTPQAPKVPGSISIDELNGNSVPAGTPTRRSVNIWGYDTPPELDPIVQPAMDAAIGFNDNLASLGGVVLDDMDVILTDMVGQGFLDDPAQGKKMLQTAFEKHGGAAGKDFKAVDQFWEDVGSSTATGMLMMSAMFAAAPMMAAAQGTSVGAILQQNLGKGLLQAPGTALAAEGGGIVGSKTGEVLTEGTGLEPLGATVGGIMGGAATGSERLIDAIMKGGTGALKGGALGGALEMAIPSGGIGAMTGAGVGGAKGVISGLAGGPQAMRAATKAIPEGTPALLDADASFATLGAAAKEAVEGDILRGDESIKRVLESVTGMAHPAKAAERLRGGLGRAYKIAQQKANGMWAKVDMTQPVDTTPLKSMADAMVKANSNYASENLPGDILAKINSMPLPGAQPPPRVGSALFGPGNAKAPKTPTLGDYKELRGLINAKLRDPSSSMSDTQRGYLKQLQDRMLDDMVLANPQDKSLNQAREFTRWLHTTFDEGPVGSFLNRRKGGPAMSDDGVDLDNPGAAAQRMLANPQAGNQIAQAGEKLDMPSLVSRSEQYIRERFTAAAAEGGPEAQKLLGRKDVQDFMKAFPKVDAEMAQTGDNLAQALVNRNLIEKSAFKKFADNDPQVAIARIWGGPKKIEAAREITKRLEGDPDALAAWKKGHIEQLWTTTKGSPSAIQLRLNARDTRPMLQEIFGDVGFNRLERTINDAASLEKGGGSAATKMGRKGSSIMARILGVSFGSNLAKMTGGSSLQTSAITSSAAKDMVGNWLNKMNPDKLLAQAMVDPHFERLLWARQPTNLKEATFMNDQLRKVVTATQAANSAFGQMMEPEDGNE